MTQPRLRLPLAGLHTFIGIGAITGGIVMLAAPNATPNYLRLAVPRPISLSGLALILFGAGALLVARSTLRADRSAKVSLAAAGALLTWVLVQGVLVGLRSWLQILVFLVAAAAILLTTALQSAERGPGQRSARLAPGTD
jgi:hypothetical protein